ncbi:Tetratricopeptide repeat protein [Caulifigura coniformis]|uniref:Tetratricopeptide repeat protein n=1 Tax=Caulifigura coniformis TaxID=2527983 RepID=A0A517S9Y1_9PLAN|nr:Tetratricopeptide repeat protein [Caulifigura coniformis]
MQTPRVDTPRVQTPRNDTPRVQTPRNDTPRVQTPRVETPRTPRVDTPRTPTPRVDTPRNNIGDSVPRSNRDSATPRTNTPRIENRTDAGGSANVGGNRVDGNARNNNSIDTNRRGGADAGVGSRIDGSTRTPRNALPGVGDRRGNDSTGPGNAADRLRDNADRIGDRTRDGANNMTDRARDRATDGPGNAADRLRDNANRIEDRANDRTRDAADRARDTADRTRDRVGNDRDGNNPVRDADRVDRDSLNPRLRDQLDRARDNANRGTRDANERTRDANDRIRDANDRIGDRADNVARDANRERNREADRLRDNLRDSVRPIVGRQDRLDPEVRNRIAERERITVRANNRDINLTPFNRPGLGRGFGRDNIGDRRVALNGLLHSSRVNRNVRYNGRFNDWHAWNGNSYWRHNNWHRGYWNFNRWNGFYGPNWWGFGIGFGGRWGGGWGGWGGGWGGWGGGWGYPVARSFGLSPWGMNYVGYNFGLYDYYNPYCYQPVPFYGGYNYDYTQPLIVNSYNVDPGVVSSGTVVQNVQQQPQQADEPDMALFDQARSAFTAGNYEDALRLTEQQIQKTPKDSILHEFRGLVLFALGRFEDAAVPVYAVLAVGPGWDWTTMSSLYSNVDAYASQLKALEDFHRNNQDNAAASFLLGYHYLTCGHNEAAAAQLDNVLRINPQDIVATRLLQALGDGSTQPADQTPMTNDDNAAQPTLAVPEVPDLPAAAMVTAEELHGTWTAQNAKGKTFTLTLTPDGTFEWVSKGKEEDKTIDQKGVFGVEGETLAMEPDGGGVLVGRVTKPENGAFKLELVGGLPDDPALEFKKMN